MKVVIFGSRDFARMPNRFAKQYHGNRNKLEAALEKYEEEYSQVVDLINTFESVCGKITKEVDGAAEGVDSAGTRWSTETGTSHKSFPAQWKVNGKLDRGAGFKRNIEMADYAECGIAIIKGKSRGSIMMLGEMKKRNKFVMLLEVD